MRHLYNNNIGEWVNEDQRLSLIMTKDNSWRKNLNVKLKINISPFYLTIWSLIFYYLKIKQVWAVPVLQ